MFLHIACIKYIHDKPFVLPFLRSAATQMVLLMFNTQITKISCIKSRNVSKYFKYVHD